MDLNRCFRALAAACLLVFVPAAIQAAPQTERVYLSGKGPKDAVAWEFSVTEGRRAGEKTTIPVPSVWEQHGFGTYNYGNEGEAREHGHYKRRFTAPAEWKGKRVRLVFEGVMTDATVRINGVSAGPVHQGAFYRFSYDVTPHLKLGEDNLIEVDVAKESSNTATNKAERHADYWVFGGIFRPVWLEVSPVEAIRHVALDGRADGSLSADIQFDGAREATRVEGQVLTKDGKAVGAPVSLQLPAGGSGRVQWSTQIEAPRLWTAETPNLYDLRLTLYKGDETLHTTTQRFGFRTFEVRAGESLFLNGQRILLKGVNRHSFRPQTARALNPEDSYDDVRLVKSMNMNAIRMSHYPPDPALLEAADELGLYVLNELSGWQAAHDTVNGRLLVREMVERDVNHPSILFWDNGNEGGWNRDLDGEFALYDPQKRRVLHPWELHDDIDTKHYSNWDDLTKRLASTNLLMPTEVLHALYDGGAGAGLDDYWTAISTSPRGAGMFHWVFADEGIARSDRGGAIDNFSTFAPDGLVGPNHEKEGSYHTIRSLWSPIQIMTPPMYDGTLAVTNHYDFTALSQVRFEWQTVRFPGPADKGTAPNVIAHGAVNGPDIAAHPTSAVHLDLPGNWRSADAVMVTAIGPDNQPVWTWSWPVATPALPAVTAGGTPTVTASTDDIRLAVGAVSASFDPTTGLLRQVSRDGKILALSNGPRLVFARPRTAEPTWLDLEPRALAHALAAPQMADIIEVDPALDKNDSYAGFKLEITADGQSWKTLYDSTRRAYDGNRYSFAPQMVSAIRFSPPTSDSGRTVPIKTVRLGFEADRFPAPAGPAVITTGTANGEAWLEARGGGLDTLRWTLRGDGSLKLDYTYTLNGAFLYHGVTFDHPEDRIASVRSLGRGPYRVWQNRLRGPELGVREAARSVDKPGAAVYPEFQGYFAGLRWARFKTDAGAWTVNSASDDVYLRIGTPQLGHINTSPDFPAGDISFMAAIPAMGSKFVTPENTGPASQPAQASGTYSGSLVFTFTGP
ncbi:evolved beta-galactosidase subunit alpha [Asticcacaulis biprosthecium C19]|uniref:beta-galactosidase n=1 Tax=Asticcacaulis biprosthecium C19 TaxID=715226 RepID=F4QP40_9CAUL|nr:glycoside hydrolase family 2 TIM barrel-domain containing protein [Asticcacaulis biprosthecium]EGF91098.1 evolved beta-galactosidase subunit alpha [Asticcacaulis biprosthecium C19]